MGSDTASSSTPLGSTWRSARIVHTYTWMTSGLGLGLGLGLWLGFGLR